MREEASRKNGFIVRVRMHRHDAAPQIHGQVATIDSVERSLVVDGLIAERIMGYSSVNIEDTLLGGVASCQGPKGRQLLPKFSSDISEAWRVVDRLDLLAAEAPDRVRALHRNAAGGWSVSLVAAGKTTEEVSGESAPMAICLAALKVAGVPV